MMKILYLWYDKYTLQISYVHCSDITKILNHVEHYELCILFLFRGKIARMHEVYLCIESENSSKL